MQEQLDEVRKAQKKIQLEVPDMQSKLQTIKNQLSGDLEISEYTYTQLKAKEDLSIKDFVLIKVYENTAKYLRETETVRKELNITKERLLSTISELDETRTDLNRLEANYVKSNAEGNKRIEEYATRVKNLQGELARMDSQVADLKEKGVKYEEVRKELKEIIEQRDVLKIELSEKENTNKKYLEGIKDQDREILSLKQKLGLLTNDKSYLQKEAASLAEKNNKLEHKNDQLLKEVQELKRKNNQYIDKMLNSNDSAISKYEEKYMQQLDELKDKHRKEIEVTKSSITEIYEKRIQYLTECKDENDIKVVHLEQQLKDKGNEYEELLSEYHGLKKKFDEECTTLRLELRFKIDEIAKLTTKYEEELKGYKDCQLEVQSLKEKLELLRMECYKMENAFRQSMSDIKAENIILKERIENYEHIENELDQAISELREEPYINTLSKVSTITKKKLKESLILSTKLLERQKEVERLTLKLKEKENEYERQAEETKLYKRLTEKTSEPFGYLTGDIKKVEKNLYLTEKESKKKDQIIENLKKEVEMLREVYTCLTLRVRN